MAILIFAAHPDDEVLGAGGTIAKYAQAGEHIVSVIFSYGEGSDPTKEPVSLVEERVMESRKAAKLLGIKEVIFLGLSDLKFSDQVGQPATKKKLHDILQKYAPKKIFTHSPDDPHPAHRGVAKLVKEILAQAKIRTEIFSFTISMPIKFTKRDAPRIYVDITKTFPEKLKALKLFKTQKHMLLFYFLPLARAQAWLAGFKARCKYAEIFYKW